MGIFSKKTNEPIGSSDLAKKVEEYNQKFLASQEQTKTNAVQSATDTARPKTAKSQGNFDGEGFRVVSAENMNYAYGHMHRFVGTISSEKVKAIVLTCFDGDTPSPQSLRAATQFFNLTFCSIWNPDNYSLDDMKHDVDKLCEFLNEQDDIGLFAFMMGYPKYIVEEIRKNLRNAEFTDQQIDDVTEGIGWARDVVFEVAQNKIQ